MTTTAPTGTTTTAQPSVPVPADHLDLLVRPIVSVLTTMGADGWPRSSLVWADHDGECARVNTTLERQKGRNLLANPKSSLLVVDPENTGRFVQIRGDVEILTEGAIEHLDALTRKYTPHPCYYGHVYPESHAGAETHVVCRIVARRVTADAIHA